jgi:hypothetical protein
MCKAKLFWGLSGVATYLGLLAGPTLGTVNIVPNSNFQGAGGTVVGNVTGTIPDQWRGFAVGGGAADISIVPIAVNALYPGSPATNGVKLRVNTFGADQGFDNSTTLFKLTPGAPYHLEFYVKSGAPNGMWENFGWSFPLFDANKNFLGRQPGGGTSWEDSGWLHVVGPTFSDPDAAYGHIAFRVYDDGYYVGEKSIIIAMPDVEEPLTSFPLPTPADLAQRTTWTSSDKLIGTTYFYWYRWADRHFFNQPGNLDALSEHFVSPQTVSMDSKDWHKQQLSDMIAAGIDMMWPVYWGAPYNFEKPDWSYYWQALSPLQTAIDELRSEGKTPPKIGMFYDTSTLANSMRGASPPDGGADLKTQTGKDLFYGTIRSFFCNVMPKNWACIDGHPIVVLYSTGAVTSYDQSVFDYVKTQFAADFGGITPYIIRDTSWNASTDSWYRWGAALRGPYLDGIAAIGPGYNDTACPGRSTPIRMREDGNYYRWSWLQVLHSNARIVHLETWNEMHEGTGICESLEYGRQYIDLTAQYAAHFKAGTAPNETVTLMYPDPEPRPPNMTDGVEYANARSVEISAAAGQKVKAGIDDCVAGDGTVTLVSHAGDSYLQTDAGYPLRYGYFSVKDPFYFDQHRRVQVTIDYLDEGTATVQLQYDSYDRTAPLEGAYANAPGFAMANSGGVRTWSAVLENPRFANRQNSGGDFRVSVINGPLYIKRIRVDVLNLPEPNLRVTAISPAAGTIVRAPSAITVTFATNVLASSVRSDTVRFVRSGGDGVFGDATDVTVPISSYSVANNQITMSLTNASPPNDTYRLTLVGRGLNPIFSLYNRPLDGKFTGTLPSGDGTGGSDFVATFTFGRPGDLDEDGDSDQEDFGRFQACFSGSDPFALGCQFADFTGDQRVNDADLAIFLGCMRGPGNPSGCN